MTKPLIAQVLTGPGYDNVPNSIFDKFQTLFFNPARGGGAKGNYDFALGFLVSRILTFVIVASGLFFFVKLISAGYTYLTSLGEPAKIQAATKELTNAAIGLVVVISSYFLAQIIEVVLGISIL